MDEHAPIIIRLMRELHDEPFNPLKQSELVAAMSSPQLEVKIAAIQVAKRRGIQVVYAP